MNRGSHLDIDVGHEPEALVTGHTSTAPKATASGSQCRQRAEQEPAAAAVGCLAIAVILCLTPALSHAGDDAPRPNIVLILCDDLGYADVGFNGAKDITTPAIDALANNGTVFTSAYVTHPFCGPSRMGLLAGRYPHSFGAPFNLPPTGSGFDRYDEEGIPVDETLIGTVLQRAGYFTGAIGKWHLGFAPQFHPNRRGFDDFYGFLGGGHMYFPDRYAPIHQRQKKAGKTRFNEYITPLEHNGKVVRETEYMTDALSREAVRFVKEASRTQKPFFLYLAYNAPHTPLEAKEDDIARFEHIKDEKRRTYAAMVYAVDRGVGRLVDALKATHALDKTLIVFLSDNGGKTGGGSSNAPLRMGKGSVCEGGFRVPMFFHWPRQVAAGRRFEHPVSALDFYPTFTRLAGASVPEEQKLDGKDIWESVAEGKNPRPGESIFALRHWKGFHNVGIRRDGWKALKRGPNGPWELFDMESDVGEERDVSQHHSDTVESMVAEARQWSASHTAPRWFITASAETSWRQRSMPDYESTFREPKVSAAAQDPSVDPRALASGKDPSRKKQRTEPADGAADLVKKQSPTDWTLEEWKAKEKVKWEKNGWRWKEEKVEAAFREIDTNSDGLATRKERQAWYAKKAAERSQPKAAVGVDSAARRKELGKPNVLFIAIDDLRPELGCYGSRFAITPNLDAIANDGLLFKRAYCQQAICRPSRASLMTGMRPESTGLFHNYVSLRELQPDILTLPQHLIAHGYETAYVGKIFHQGDTDDERSWSREPVKWIRGIKKPQGPYRLAENVKLRADNFKEMFARYGEAAKRGLASGPAFERADVPDHAYPDGHNTLLAVSTLKEMAKGDKPFFLGMGYKLPHLNWCSPEKYWRLYDPQKIPMASETNPPSHGAAMGLHASFELRTRSNIPKYGPIGPDLARTLKHAYLASTSYVDAQIGLLVKALDEAGVRDNTIIIVWGDHGWHLGDMGVWGKATNYEIATRVPLMIRTPEMKTRGQTSDALVELVDIFPTLCELTRVPVPRHLEGHSFVPLLDRPHQSWKKAAFSQYPNPALREWAANPLSQGMRETWFGPLIEDVEQRIIDQQGNQWNRELFEEHLMGYTMRTDRYRIVAWRDHRDTNAEPLFVELFDHESDPEETVNIADQNPDVVQRLMKQMNAGWKAALEPNAPAAATTN